MAVEAVVPVGVVVVATVKWRSSVVAAARANTTRPGDDPPPDAGAPLELTVANVDAVLDEVRLYLISDGGNVSVRGVDDGEDGGGARGGRRGAGGTSTSRWRGRASPARARR